MKLGAEIGWLLVSQYFGCLTLVFKPAPVSDTTCNTEGIELGGFFESQGG